MVIREMLHVYILYVATSIVKLRLYAQRVVRLDASGKFYDTGLLFDDVSYIQTICCAVIFIILLNMTYI